MLRRWKDEAADAFEARRYATAAALYERLATVEEDPAWLHRAGEAHRRAGNLAQARERLRDAALAFARAGFSAKAVAVAKILGAMSPAVGATERLLAEIQDETPRVPRSPRRVEPPPAPRK